MKAHNTLNTKARNTLKPRSGFACVNATGLREVASRGSRYTMYRTSAFAELSGVPHEAKIQHLRKKTLLKCARCLAL